VILKKFINVDTIEIESFIFIHSNYDFNYAVDTFKELIQLSVAQYEMKRIYFESRIFYKFAKEVLITIRADRLIEKQLITIKAIENVRKMRVNQSKKSVQRRNVIRVKDCRRMIIDRKDEENRLKQERKMRIMR
jgi:hypothetical protein